MSKNHENQSQKVNKNSKNQLTLRVAINGFGRIGRNVLRSMLQRNILVNNSSTTVNIELVAINDVASNESLVHLLKFDSTHGRLSAIGYNATLDYQLDNEQLEREVNQQGNKPEIEVAMCQLTLSSIQPTPTQQILQNNHHIQMLSEPNPERLPWQQLQIDLVLECSGHFRAYNEAHKHLEAGAKQVIIGAAPFDDVDACIVMGVNEQELTKKMPIISSVSCTTQALVPLLSTLDNTFGVQSVMMTEIHAVTADQNVLDQAHRDFKRARAAGYNIIPTTSSSIKATERVLPQLTNKINGHSIRVPTINVAAIDVTVIFESETVDIPTLQASLKNACQKQLQGIMGYSDEPLVSSDFLNQPESLIIDSLQMMRVGNQFKIFAWYDNEWGYANRLVDMCVTLAKMS